MYVAQGTVTLTNDTLTTNNALGGAGGNGGGSGQRGPGKGGDGGAGLGGGLSVDQGTGVVVTLTNDTFSGNSVQGGSGGSSGNGGLDGNNGGNGGNASGGGLFLVSGSTTTLALANTLIARDTMTAGTGGAAGGGIFTAGAAGSPGSASGPDVSGSVTSHDHNLIGDGTGSNLLPVANGDKVGTSVSPIDPLLGPLQNNGGPTQTMALLPNSPAIDAGTNSLIPAGVSTDQRGFARIGGTAVDIGAFELQKPTITGLTIPATGAEGSPVALSAAATDSAGVNAPLSYTWTVTRPDRSTFTLSGASTSFTPVDNGAYGVSLAVGDGDGGTDTRTATVAVANVAPTITAFAVPTAGAEGSPVTLSATATDPAGANDPLSYAWTVTRPDGTTLTTLNGNFVSFTPPDDGG